MAEFIYQMYQARKAHGDKVILDDVTLSFYPGAKIGVVGPNGMGKSTLLKIIRLVFWSRSLPSMMTKPLSKTSRWLFRTS